MYGGMNRALIIQSKTNAFQLYIPDVPN